MIELTPKKRFQERDDQELIDFRNAVTGNLFQSAVETAMADWVIRGRPSAEELDGARSFLSVFINLAEEETAPAGLPQRRLMMPKPEPPKPLPPRQTPPPTTKPTA